MKLNIPEGLLTGKKVLYIGIGGGYDIYGSIPLAETHEAELNVFLNYNTKIKNMAQDFSNEPEGKLQQWLSNQDKKALSFALPKLGVVHLKNCIQSIVSNYNIDQIVAIDGGVDSLMHGDEEGAGTFLEDSAVMAAISLINLPKVLVCLGFGTEIEEEVCHYSVLENIQEYIRDDAFLGSCSLTKFQLVFGLYKNACEFAWENSRKSHVQTRVIESVVGEKLYDSVEANVLLSDPDKNTDDYTSSLMSIYWFFDFNSVVKKNKLIPHILKTNTHTDILMTYRGLIDVFNTNRRKRKALPY